MTKTHTAAPADLRKLLTAAGVGPADIGAFESFFEQLGKPAAASERRRSASAKPARTGLDVAALVARCRAATRSVLIAALPDHVRGALRRKTDPIAALPSGGAWNDGRLADRRRGHLGAHP